MSHNTEPTSDGEERRDAIGVSAPPEIVNDRTAPQPPDDIGLIPEVVEIRLDYTKDAVQMAKGGCRRWK